MIKLDRAGTGILVAVVSAALFGIYPSAARGVYEAGGNAAFVILSTTFFRMLSLVGFCLLTRKELFRNFRNTKRNAIGGVLQAVSIICIFLSLNYIPGPVMITIVFSHTVLLLFFLAFKKEIKLDTLNISSALVALFGLSLALDVWSQNSNLSYTGIGIAFLAALATVGRLYIFGRSSANSSAAVVGAENFIFASVFVCALLFFDMPVPPVTTGGYVFAGLAILSLVLGSFGLFYGIALLGPFRFSLCMKLEPISTSLFAVILLGEVLSFIQYAGIALVVGSLFIYNLLQDKEGNSLRRMKRFFLTGKRYPNENSL